MRKLQPVGARVRWMLFCYWILFWFHPFRNVLAWWVDLPTSTTGSGDTSFKVLLVFVELTVAVLASLILPKERAPGWSTLSLVSRFILAAVLVEYGFLKVFQLQMSQPGILRLTRALGDSSPMGLLWAFVGASPAYQSLLGWVEVVGGLALLWAPTRGFGILVCLVATSQIFLLNLCYDVPVKTGSLHYLLLSILLCCLHFNEPVTEAAREAAWKRNLHLLAAIYILWSSLSLVWSYPQREKAGPLNGIWQAVEPHQVRHLLIPWPGVVVMEKFDGSRKGYRLERGEGWLKFGDFRLDFELGDDTMKLCGQVDGIDIDMRYNRKSLDDFNLRNHHFRWIQERPDNR